MKVSISMNYEDSPPSALMYSAKLASVSMDLNLAISLFDSLSWYRISYGSSSPFIRVLSWKFGRK